LLKSARSPLAVLKLPTKIPVGLLGAAKPTLLKRANAPVAVLELPPMLLKSAPASVAVFSSARLARSEPAPTPVQKLPSVRLRGEYIPIAVFYVPLVRLSRAEAPSAVLPPG
jgi:hypothetical protein